MVELKERSADLSTFVAVGELSPEELFETYRAFVDSAPTSLATLARIDAESMRQLARRTAALGMQRRIRGRAAIVCARDVDFGMARMFSTLASLVGHPIQFAVFPGPNSARAWLTGETHYP
jgi:deoxyribodipyrimidine photolyase